MSSNTATSFSDKWKNNPELVFEETLREGSEIFLWILNRNGFKDSGELSCFLKSKNRILDAGCGNGRVTALLRKYSNPATTEIIGIDFVASKIAKKNLASQKNISFYKKDLLDDLTDLGKFDLIYCQEVLHHTKNPQQAFLNLTKILNARGEIAIYVYKKKAPIREFTDDFIRKKISAMTYEEAMKVCEEITTLGKSLSDSKIKIQVLEVNVLEIKAGEYDLQRFLYHFFMKCFWNDNLSFHDNAVINYDWYHPQDCSRHTIEEVRKWFADARLNIAHEHVDFYGITMRGIKG